MYKPNTSQSGRLQKELHLDWVELFISTSSCFPFGMHVRRQEKSSRNCVYACVYAYIGANFFYFSSFLVWRRVQHVWPQKNSPSSQEK